MAIYRGEGGATEVEPAPGDTEFAGGIIVEEDILSKGKIIHQKDRIDEYGNYVDFFVIYKKSLWLCESQTNLKLSNAGLIVCVEHKSYPARDTEGDTVID